MNVNVLGLKDGVFGVNHTVFDTFVCTHIYLHVHTHDFLVPFTLCWFLNQRPTRWLFLFI